MLQAPYAALQRSPGRGAAGHDSQTDYQVAREAATSFYERLRELFAQGKSTTTFGPTLRATRSR